MSQSFQTILFPLEAGAAQAPRTSRDAETGHLPAPPGRHGRRRRQPPVAAPGVPAVAAEGSGATGTRAAYLALAVTTVGVFMAFLDVTIVNTAFPQIQRSFAGTPLSELSWVVNIYNVVIAALLIPAGRLSDRMGRKRAFYLGAAVFLLGSVLCASAWDVTPLIGGRLVQAVGAAVMIPSSLGLALPAFPEARRGLVTSTWAATGALASAAGPSLGGVLVESFGWRAAFTVNLVIALALIPGLWVLKEQRDASRRPIDWVSAALVAIATGGLALGIVRASEWGWTSAAVLGCLVTALVAAVGVTIRSRRHASPLVEPELLRMRAFRLGSLGLLLVAMSFYAVILGNILFLTRVWHYDVLTAGFAVAPGALFAAIASRPAARIGERFGLAAVAGPAGLMLAAACLLYRDAAIPTPDYLGHWLPAQAVSGCAVGALFSVLAAAVMRDVPSHLIATATAVSSCAREIGAVIGVALLIAVLQAKVELDAIGAFHQAWTISALVAVAAAFVGLAIPRRAAR